MDTGFETMDPKPQARRTFGAGKARPNR